MTVIAPKFTSAVVVASLALTASAIGAAGPSTKFGKPDTGEGIASVNGTAANPRGLSLRVHGTAGLIVSVTTVVGCKHANGKTKGGDGAFNAVAPFTRELRQPLRKAESCTVSIVATYEQGSEDPIKAQLFAGTPKR